MSERREELVVAAELPREESYEASSAGLWRLVDALVDVVPSHRNTREGRRTAKAMKVAVGAVGLLLAVFAGPESLTWLVVGGCLVLLALLVPVSELKKRSWKGKVKRRTGTQTRTVWDAGEVRYDGRRVELFRGEEKVRQVSVGKGDHEVVWARLDDRPCLGVLPRGKRKKESIWVIAKEPVAGVDVEEWEDLDKKRVDQPGRVSARGFEELSEAVGEG